MTTEEYKAEYKTAVNRVDRLIKQSGWDWTHPRLNDWLERVRKHYGHPPYTSSRPIPLFVLVSLAKFMDARIKCELALDFLEKQWDDPVVKEIERKYRCIGQLPLKGYLELNDRLDREWF